VRPSQRSGSERPVRCAVYTRKSTTEGLDSGFSTLDAQREACEHYVHSQAAQGWELLPARYDDGGFTGGNLDRPAMARLLDDVERGLIDMVVVYKVDRLSRSLLDFASLMARFERLKVGFVSITQHFDTSTSMGRLVLNILLSFAQFERELISERTRDKVQAARRRGRWTGGHVVLGYALDPARRGLQIAKDEAALVRLIFELYLRTRSIGAVAEKLNSLGYVQKRGEAAWTKAAVYSVLRNPLYVGKVRSGAGELHPGEHEPLVELELFEQAGRMLADRTTGRTRRSRKMEYLLAGLLRCGACEAPMISSMSRGRNGRRYRYYRCRSHQQRAKACPTGHLAAEKVEAVVLAQLAEVVRQAGVQQNILDRLSAKTDLVRALEDDRGRLQRRIIERSAEAERLLNALGNADRGGKLLGGRLGEIEAELDGLRGEVAGLDERLGHLVRGVDEAQRVARLLQSFTEIWDVLLPEERSELLRLVVDRITMDSASGGLRIALHHLEAEPRAGSDAVALPQGR
jgi:site-specific DNA recombinase